MSDKEVLVDDDEAFEELKWKWRGNSLTGCEKDLYIKHLTLRHIDRKKKVRELEAEVKSLEEVLILERSDFNDLYDLCDSMQTEVQQLKHKYESTPQRALKAVMQKHELSLHGSVDAIGIIQEPYKTIACCSQMGPCCGTFTITAEDINDE